MGSRRDKKKGLSIGGKFTPILNDEIGSKAFKDLSGGALRLLVLFKQAHSQVGYKHGERQPIFAFPYSRAKKHGMSESTTRRAIRDLWHNGFIDVISIGGLRGAGRTNSQYKMAELWRTYGNPWTDRTKFQQDPFNVSEPI